MSKSTKITAVRATALSVPASFDYCGRRNEHELGICIVEITTEAGHVGVGMTAITEESVVACAINEIAAPALVGQDALNIERIWDKLYWLMTPRGQSGYAMHAIAAVDLALWDIKGQALGLPVWRLLGGARPKVQTYATIGFDFFDREQLAEVAATWKARGFSKFKMVVGHNGLKRRDEPRPLMDVMREDIKRVEILREAAGEDAELFVDANCNLDLYHATWLARRIEAFDISFFEEPLVANDVHGLRELRGKTSIPLAGGQNEGQIQKFRDFLLHGALDVLQPNVAITGGITLCRKIAAMAEGFGVNIDNGGAWPFHNMHLHAGLRNGGMIEYHIFSVECLSKIFNDLPVPQDGWLELPDTPGLGFTLNREALNEFAVRPS